VSKQNDIAKQRAELARRLSAAERLMFADEAKQSLLKFTQYCMTDPNDTDNPRGTRYQVAPHHRVLAEALEEVAQGKCLRLIISVPPQHGKSELASRKFPAYFMGRMPWKHIIHATYSQDFAEQFGQDVRDLMETPDYGQVFQGVKMRKGSRAKDHLVMEQGGKLSFIGRGGAGTGKPADLFIIDDPIKDAKEAESATIRNDVWEWFTKVAYTRCHVASAIIIIMTRWHEDDLVGRLTDRGSTFYSEEEASKWTVLNLPAILTQAEEPLAKALGIPLVDGQAALWPQRFPLEHLASAKRLNPLGFSALYMGKPTPPEGSFFKRTMFPGYDMTQLPKQLRYYGTADLAVSPERDRDKTAILNWALDEDDTLWLLPDCYWGRMAADASVESLIDYGIQYGWMDFFWEKGPINRSLSPFLVKRMGERNAYFPLHDLPTTGNKAARAQALRGRMAQGKVRFPTFAPWWPEALEVFLKFTGSGSDKEDDIVDAAALIGAGLSFQVRADAARKSADVVQIGSMRWVKEMSRIEANETARKRRLGGM
jgi:predicted phage terminase large subunit-like protein